MKIYGTTTSPFVRRLRLLLAEYDYEFVKFNIFGAEREKLKSSNPTLKIPMFEDSDIEGMPTLFDSGVTYRYLADRLSLKPLDLQQQNILSVIDACSDSLVNLMLLNRSGIDTQQDKLYFNIQKERQQASFEFLEREVKAGAFDRWNYLSICLLVLVEWSQFRELYDFSSFPALLDFVESKQSESGVLLTKPCE